MKVRECLGESLLREMRATEVSNAKKLEYLDGEA
jgi:hypothetical protein